MKVGERPMQGRTCKNSLFDAVPAGPNKAAGSQLNLLPHAAMAGPSPPLHHGALPSSLAWVNPTQASTKSSSMKSVE